MADSKRVAYEKELAKKLLQQKIDRAKEGGYKTKEELRQERVAQQKTNTSKLLTPGSSIKGLVGTNTAPFNATSVTFNGLPALRAKGAFVQQNNQFGKPGYLPESIQYAGTTLYGQQKGDNIFYTAKNKTPLMQSFKPTTKTPVPTPTPTPTPTPEPSLVRQETVIKNANDVEQRGTQMSVSAANGLLSGGYEIQNPFASTQLPTTAYSPYAGQGMSKVYDQENLQSLYGDVNSVQLATDLFGEKSGVKSESYIEQPTAMDVYGKGSNEINQLQAKGAAFLVRNGEIPTTGAVDPANSGTNWAARTAADNSDPNLARRKAFLNPDRNAFQALRDVEAQQGLSYASGQHYMHNPTPNEEGKYTMTAITGKDRQDDVRGYKSGRLSASDLKDKYMGAITASKYSPINADNIVDTLTMDSDYMTGATPSKSITDNTNMMDTDIDYEAMSKRNPGGMIGGITYKR